MKSALASHFFCPKGPRHQTEAKCILSRLAQTELWPLVTNCNWLAPSLTNQLSRCFINPSTASLSTERIKPKLVGNRNQSISCYLWHLSVAANGKLTTLLNIGLLLWQSSERRILCSVSFIHVSLTILHDSMKKLQQNE